MHVGATGTGKSTAMKAKLARPFDGWRIIVDPDGEYSRFGLVCRTLANVVAAIRGPRGCVVFVPSLERAAGVQQFTFLCVAAWRLLERGTRVHFVVDELAEFTTAQLAPGAWRRLVKRGRKKGCSIDVASQRPAEIDKTIWSNPSTVRSGRLGYADDQTVVAAALGVPVDQVRSLGQLEYLERDFNSGELRRGRLTF